jgi:endonuclease/exonuclease/phosphatase (EEP) superfamily protein YafD
MPEPLSVEEDLSGAPKAIRLKQRHIIVSVEDCWRIDDEWWRSEPVSRMYYAVTLDSGRRLVLCHNLINNHWYTQTY